MSTKKFYKHYSTGIIYELINDNIDIVCSRGKTKGVLLKNTDSGVDIVVGKNIFTELICLDGKLPMHRYQLLSGKKIPINLQKPIFKPKGQMIYS